MTLPMAVQAVHWADHLPWMLVPAVAPGTHPAIEHSIGWLLACAAALLAIVAVASVIAAVMYAERTVRRFRGPLLRADWIRQLPSHDRRWLVGSLRIARRIRAPGLPRPWPGPGIIGAGLQNFDWRLPNLLPAEGEWLKRSGLLYVLRGGDACANLIFLFFAVFPITLTVQGWSNTTDWKPVAILLILNSIYFGTRWLVGVGLLFRGLFDAHIDARAIEFAGPWRTDSFERDHTIVYLIRAGPFVDTTLLHRSGRRARMLLTNHGAKKLLSVWSD
ncbi:MAG: hypothetical protein JNK58_00025 [Phycisphaerae bacterium]|nr:hypothetical protein [Phycisphaerae bacterium]